MLSNLIWASYFQPSIVSIYIRNKFLKFPLLQLNYLLIYFINFSENRMAFSAMLAGCTEALLCPFERVQTVLQDKRFHGMYKYVSIELLNSKLKI